jgi:DNA-binding PadR family transcriptional regulator
MGVTEVGKGSLSNHLEKLEKFGYVTITTRKTFGGYRTTVEMTERGLEAYNNLVKTLASFRQARGSGIASEE